MIKDKQTDFMQHVFLRLQWQRFTPRRAQKTAIKKEVPSTDPVLEDYREGRISKTEVCQLLGIDEKDLLRTLVRKGELFG